ncbi:hypothetical protein BO71DRAFT_458460 [Aspergillus ellipticus CBS 707.79]|uniref:T6SS Phospholipase effector Tle1-like catalytic domain-containing protein n=1 Tax=Aspergillus ellipticus CBS 707.79 TaxID=1448320 RepID=A0A319D4K8_9EURO|nr:hypothetical protein BO71DRAFT_458460 [Aspergillus ellipticus CBS 707.79]
MASVSESQETASGAAPPPVRQVVLCFDGTGNTFRTDGTNTNILKICGLLEKSDEQRKPYPLLLCTINSGIGTNITPGSLASTMLKPAWAFGHTKAFKMAMGKSFEDHVLGGYRFLMGHYRDGAQIFIFGFSRGAFTARVLNEMLDAVGLLGPDNEEVLPLLWDAFITWKLLPTYTNQKGTEKIIKAQNDIGLAKETLSRHITPRVRFLGMFDAVNSVANFKALGMHVKTETEFVRHAVSIDERRVKFRPLLTELAGETIRDDTGAEAHRWVGPWERVSRRNGIGGTIVG